MSILSVFYRKRAIIENNIKDLKQGMDRLYKIAYKRTEMEYLKNLLSDLRMAHPEGFEPPTNWFEANYSIQLS